MEAPLPENEAARLEALRRYQIMDTPREEEYDDIVRLAAQICGTPISLVSLINTDRQWFKGRYGLELQETPRKISFCAHTILQAPDPLEIHDATKDERFADNELVTGGPQLRFYAGAPLVTPEGQALGTLCVLDTKPRQLSAEQKEALGILSRQVMTQLELRRRLAELSQASDELKEVNGELEGFAHAISHDLRTPLRATISMAEILLAREGDKLGAMGKSMVVQIKNSGQRMAEMLEDFLRLLRLRDQPLRQAQIEMKNLVQSVVNDLQPQISEIPTQLEIGDLPSASVDRGLICQVWTNLISNALKFSRDRNPRVIKVKGTEAGDRLVYSVEDNGTGFDPTQANRLFIAFNRLHGMAYEGTGLGLSIVKRIVRLHGGEVWAESAPGQGARFSFALPKARQ
ncbi:MAG TPA: ATP-binding protein [Clostridia bacterium]|nr:ATP-binding protein [Clostridia bacterium]